MTARRAIVREWVVVAAGWTAYALTDALHAYLLRMPGEPYQSFSLHALNDVPDALVFWTPLTLAFLALSRRLPLAGALWPWGVAKLVAATVAAVVARAAYGYLIEPIFAEAYSPFDPLPPLPDGLLRAIYLQQTKVLLVVCLCFAWVQIRRTHENRLRIAELETRLARARLDALSAQLNPHFLFNALNSIAELIHRDAQAAGHMLKALATLLRFSLANPRDEIRVGEEIALAAHFLSIEKIRYGDRLDVRWSVDADCADALVPALILQPLAENAVVHGIARRRAAGTVSIAVRRSGAMLVAEVGNDAPSAPAPPAPGHGVGIANARDRLSCLYGDAWSLTQGLRDERYLVRIELPLHDTPTQARPPRAAPPIA